MGLSKAKQIVKRVIPDSMLSVVRQSTISRRIKKVSKIQKRAFDANVHPHGINVAGYFRQESGLGQSCRLVANAVKHAGIPHAFVDVDRTGIPGADHSFDGDLTGDFVYGVNLFCVNMGDFPSFLKNTPRDVFDCCYNIAFWLWEVDEFPQEWVPLIGPLDEIWTPAEFISNAIRKVTDKPVITVPYGIERPFVSNLDRRSFGLPEDRFLFLMMYDSYSIAKRKNPLGVIEAFKEAFAPGEQVGLVIKVSHAEKGEISELKGLLSGYDAYFIDGVLPKVEISSLIEISDVYVSLHRAEGFGLVLAEAMLLGTPTIATNYSANTEFQNEETAYLVDCDLVPIGEDIYPYKRSNSWANPDISDAAAGMQRFFEDKVYYDSVCYKAQKSAERQLSVDCAAKRIAAQMKRIYGVF